LTAEEARPEAKKLKADLSGDVVSFDNSGIDKYPIMISDDLAQFFGTGERSMFHAEALGRVWDHIKSNHLEVHTLLCCLIQLFIISICAILIML
jgi:upstream activation factor subunit UAF30